MWRLPGGDGYSGPGKKLDKPLTCVPYAGECSVPNSGGVCEYGLVSLVTKQTVTDTGFAYWAGISFAAPLVTGMAARKIASKINQGVTIQGVMGEIVDDACPQPTLTLSSALASSTTPALPPAQRQKASDKPDNRKPVENPGEKLIITP